MLTTDSATMTFWQILFTGKKNFTNMVKSWQVSNASRNETNEILTVYLVKGSALYKGDTDQDDL